MSGVDDIDSLMADLGFGDPAPQQPARGGASQYGTVPTPQSVGTDEVDDIMSELGLTDSRSPSHYGNVPTQPQQAGGGYQAVPKGPALSAESEVDDLLADLGLGSGGGGGGGGGAPAKARGGFSSGPGRGGFSSGPGRGGFSSGPGRGRGLSSGPGRPGMSSGPGRGRVSMGPGMSAGPGAMRGRGRGGARGPPKLATHTPDGRELTFNGPPCAACEEMVIGAITNALGKSYHPECFVCASCQEEFPDGEFLEHEGAPFCDKCYGELFAVKCAACQQAITDKCIEVNGIKWHPQHFCCGSCGTPLAGKPYKEDDGEIYCSNCKDARRRRVDAPAGTCGTCKRPIIGEYVTLRGQRHHPKHFRCEECGCAFVGGNCHEYEGRLYCKEDWLKLLKDICSFCHKPIIGRSFTAMGRVWHPEHFVCFTCKEPFHGSSYMEKNGNPYCEICWHRQFGQVCAKCDRVVMGRVIRALGKSFHPEHFTCNGCDASLAEGHYEWETKALCKKCFSKLPKDVRARIEKKRREQLKAEKARQQAGK